MTDWHNQLLLLFLLLLLLWLLMLVFGQQKVDHVWLGMGQIQIASELPEKLLEMA